MVCPTKAISERERVVGTINSDLVDSVRLTFGKLKIGEPMAVPVIKAVKEKLHLDEVNILDAPPGTSCTLIETVLESDFIVLVTEPTPFGLHDLIMTIEVVDN